MQPHGTLIVYVKDYVIITCQVVVTNKLSLQVKQDYGSYIFLYVHPSCIYASRVIYDKKARWYWSPKQLLMVYNYN